jgi:O-antigen/teichoic acid export membrane protein
MSLTSKVAMNTTALTAGRGLLAVTGVVSVGIAARYLGLEAYGALTAATAFVTAFTPLADIGVATIAARELARNPDRPERILGAVFALSLLLTAVSALAIIAIGQILYGAPENDDIRRAVLILVLSSLPMGAPAVAASAYFVARQQAWVGVVAGVLASVVTLALLSLSVALHLGFTGIVVAYAATALVYGASMVAFAWGKIRIRPNFDRALIRQLLVWALPLGAAMIVQALYWRLDAILLSLLSSDAQVGVFGLAFKAVDAVLVLPFYITITLLPEFSRLSEERERLDALLQRAVQLMLFVIVPMFGTLFIYADRVVVLLGGGQFQEAAAVLRILLVGVATQFLCVLLGQALIALNRQSRFLYTGVLVAVVNLAVALPLIPVFDARGAAIAFSTSEAIALPALLFVYSRSGRAPRPVPPAGLVVAAGVLAASAALRLPLEAVSGDPLFVLAAGAGLSLGAYVWALYALSAMPREVHEGLLVPLWSGLRRSPRWVRDRAAAMLGPRVP